MPLGMHRLWVDIIGGKERGERRGVRETRGGTHTRKEPLASQPSQPAVGTTTRSARKALTGKASVEKACVQDRRQGDSDQRLYIHKAGGADIANHTLYISGVCIGAVTYASHVCTN